jgi:uncharacterized repeat protein (TIGR03803 family)
MNKRHLARLWDSCAKVRAGIIALTTVITLSVIAAQVAKAQTFSVLHNFTGRADGYGPTAGVTMDRAGNLYGTTEYGGGPDDGTVFQLKHTSSGWVLNSLYSFTNGADGENPVARVTLGPDGSLYGTTSSGGSEFVGTVFKLRPPSHFCGPGMCPWNISVLHTFSLGSGDGGFPATEPVFDRQGNLFGTTNIGGSGGCCGTVYELGPMAGGGWSETVIHSFNGCDGAEPTGSVVFDTSGNLYGTTDSGGNSCATGTIYQLAPLGSGWQEKVVHLFPYPAGDQYGVAPIGGVIVDEAGTLYGTTAYGGGGKSGTVFKATPSGGTWTLDLLHNFAVGRPLGQEGPVASLERFSYLCSLGAAG